MRISRYISRIIFSACDRKSNFRILVLWTTKNNDEYFRFSTILCSLMTMFAELCHNGIRDRMMIMLSFLFSLALTLVTAMSWGFLVNDWKYTFFGGSFGKLFYLIRPVSWLYEKQHNQMTLNNTHNKKVYNFIF